MWYYHYVSISSHVKFSFQKWSILYILKNNVEPFRNELMFDNILYIKLIAYLDLKSTIYIMNFINTQGHLVSALLHFQERILSRVHIHSLWVLIILWDKLYTSEEEIVNLLNHFKSCLRKVYQVKWSKCEI